MVHLCVLTICFYEKYDDNFLLLLLFRMFALERIKSAGAFITTSESILLSLTGDAAHPKFKEIQKLIADVAPESGLLRQS